MRRREREHTEHTGTHRKAADDGELVNPWRERIHLWPRIGHAEGRSGHVSRERGEGETCERIRRIKIAEEGGEDEDEVSRSHKKESKSQEEGRSHYMSPPG